MLRNLIVGYLLLVPTFSMGAEMTFYNLKAKTIRGEDMPFDQFKGKVVLLVNTASKCGYTPQYDGLEKLHQKFQAQGLQVVGFPSNDFGGQEPGSEEEIAKFCKFSYGVTFPLASKVATKGSAQSPVYAYLTTNAPETGNVRWNFEKFLVDRQGKIVGRYSSSVKPESPELVAAIEKALKAKP